ncbi:MAG: protein kinase [Archangiaceae bacterium]|nr:protein kinase [Archangiaceae bacterium]
MSVTTATVVCASCRAAIATGSRFCAQCGTQVQDTSASRDDFIGKLVGNYRVLALIGEGGMGKVYRAEQERLKRAVCIKTLLPHFAKDPSLVQRFEREGQATAAMRHPNVVTVLDFGKTDDGTLYIVMEYVEGRTLRAVLKEDAPLPLERAVNLTVQMLSGLDEAHAQGVVHRDLKPANVLVSKLRDGSEMLKVVDFGIAKLTAGDGSERGLTRTGLVVGTPGYMAPEQLTNEPVSPATDLYSAGVILWELLTGKRLFAGKNELETINRQLSQVVASPSSVSSIPIPPGLDEVCLKALERQPSARYGSALEFRRALELIAQGLRGAPVTAPASMLEPVPAQSAGATAVSNPSVAPVTIDALSRLLPSELAQYTRSLSSQLARSEKRTLHAFFLEVGSDRTADSPAAGNSLAPLFAGLVNAVTAQGGLAERFMGSCLVAVFGVHELHEDDAMRCLRAARDARAFVADSGQGTGVNAFVRIGVCASTVTGVDPSLPLHDSPAVNEVLNLARQVQGAAAAGEILLTRTVRSALKGGITVTDVPSLPGVSEAVFKLVADDVVKAEPLCGREREQAMLKNFVEGLVQRRSGGALLLGQPGIGKSRLIRFAHELASKRGVTIARARGGRLGQAAPLDVIRQLVHSLNERDRGPTEDVARTTLKGLARLGLEAVDIQRLESLFSMSTNPGVAPAAEEERYHDRAALLELFAKATQQQPLLLLIDDAQLADRLSLEIVEEVVARSSPAHPLGLLAAARPGETEGVLPRLKRVELAPLTPPDIATLVAAQLRKGRPPAPLLEAIWARCEGNPHYCNELLSAVSESGQLQFVNGEWRFATGEAELPESLAHVVAARLERIGPHAKTLLRLGAVIGRSFTVDLVSASVETPIDIAAAVNDCVRRGLLERSEQGEGVLQFSQAVVRDTILKRLAPADRRRLHQLVGEALERGCSAGSEHPLDALSRHFVGSEQPRKAMKYLRQAADRWVEKHAWDVAARQYREAYSLLAREAARLGPLSDVTSGHLLELAAAAAGAAGLDDPKGALAFLDEAMSAVPETRRGRARAEALRQRGLLELKLSRATDAVKDLREALALLSAADDVVQIVTVRTELASALETAGQLGPATLELTQAMQLLSARGQSEPASLWPCLNQLGRVHLRLGKLVEAQAFFENALVAAQNCQSAAGQGRVLANQMVLAAQRGDKALTERLYTQSLAHAREGGDRLGAIRVQYNHANWLRSSGRVAEADAELREVALRSREIGWKEGEAMAAAARPAGSTARGAGP